MGFPVVFKQGSEQVGLPHEQTSMAIRGLFREQKQLSRDSVLAASQPAAASHLSLQILQRQMEEIEYQ
jgi:hypothetical protein